MGDVNTLPIWKKDATPHERFMELAREAELRPENFEYAVVVYKKPPTADNQGYRYVSVGSKPYNVHDVIALLNIGLRQAIDWATKP